MQEYNVMQLMMLFHFLAISVFDVGFSSLSVVQPHFTPPMIPTLSPVPGSHAPPNHQTTPFHDGHQTHTKRPGTIYVNIPTHPHTSAVHVS